MVLPMPRPSIRNVLLLIVIGVWAFVVVSTRLQGQAVSADDWLVPAALIAGILKFFPNDPRAPGDGGEA